MIVRTDEGAYADRVLLPVDDVLPKPESLTWEGAACLLSSGATAYEALAVADVARGTPSSSTARPAVSVNWPSNWP